MLIQLTTNTGAKVLVNPDGIQHIYGDCGDDRKESSVFGVNSFHAIVQETPEQIVELIEGKAEAPAPEQYEDEALRQKALTEITDLRARLSKAYGDPDYYEWTRYVIALLTS